ncbi:multiheme c-type cytochrome [Chromatium okenii]|uniref:multiheme c-type cytochrome n=1 Tax=Chromatium okenii TaxID=61644 RepID=UPI0026F08859|nr:multiheme c-type cytochrome [Chromatium okenii]MBV5308331.1 nitrite reductase [Chromatium okenii]
MKPHIMRRFIVIVLALLTLILIYKVVYPLAFEAYVGKVNAPLTYSSSRELTSAEFEVLANELSIDARQRKAATIVAADQTPLARQVKIEMLMNTPSAIRNSEPKHIQYFRDADIRRYDGPETCLRCHATIRIQHGDGSHATVDTLNDLVNSVHFKFQSEGGGFSTYGYDGRQVNSGGHKIPVGKINRACGIPGSFTWTGWAALVASHPEKNNGAMTLRSEGCGQCHIGGNYQPATEKMMPIGDVPNEAKNGIDCLICHAANYAMNERYVLKDDKGLRWNQDRSLRAALTVGPISSETCLRCHQHNMGGDVYQHNAAAQELGYINQRILHRGAKRGNPFSPEDDVHAAAGIQCTDCHVPEGHHIPRGRKGVDLVANDIPMKDVTCESCHGQAPHNQSEHKALLNGHIARLACETCHIKELETDNVVLRDWVHPTWNAEEGIFEPTDIYRSGAPGKGFIFLWFNGNGTFLANALGSNPNGTTTYNPLMRQVAQITDPEVIAAVRNKATELKQRYSDIDVEAYVQTATNPLSQLSPELLAKREAMIANNLRSAMMQGESRIYPFKLFNAMMYEDMSNQGPFGAMILPFDYARYYETGDSAAAVKVAIADPIIQRMYQEPFKRYMMDEFMAYFGITDGWKTIYPLVNGQLVNVEPHWMRQMGTLMVNHGIQSKGRECVECHAPNGIMDFKQLGYSTEQVGKLEQLDGIDLNHKTD